MTIQKFLITFKMLKILEKMHSSEKNTMVSSTPLHPHKGNKTCKVTKHKIHMVQIHIQFQYIKIYKLFIKFIDIIYVLMTLFL